MEPSKIMIIAEEFSYNLLVEIGINNIKKVIELNRNEADENICHSHDFCDSYMIMFSTYSKYTNINNINNICLEDWDKIWNIAIENNFFIK